MKFLFLLILCFSSLTASPSCSFSRFFGGGQAYYYDLRIDNVPGPAASATPNPFTGWLGGFILGYEYKQPNRLYTVLQTSYALGEIQTEGSGNNKRFIHDELVDLRFGYPGVVSREWTFTPFTGAGFRWNLQYRSPGALSGEKFDYYKIYIPLGLVIDYTPNKWVYLAVDFEWMPDVLSMVSIGSMKGSFWELERMYNYLVQLPCTFTFGERWDLTLAPFWMQYGDGASIAAVQGGMSLDLDRQITNDWGGRASLGVQF